MGDLKNKRCSVRAVGGFPGEESKIRKQRVHIKQISKVFPNFLCEGTIPQKVKLVLIVVVAKRASGAVDVGAKTFDATAKGKGI